jgi:UDP-N-acetylmuramoyl-L-alanyl-D-glutamate--2,6-diaminopimelate ligase
VTEQALPQNRTSLRELLPRNIRIMGSPDVRIASCTCHWQHVRPGDVFVALVDAENDGHDRAAEAARRGAAAIVCERPLPLFDVPQFIVSDSRAAYGNVCQGLVGRPSRQLKVISVSGTHGKTTVARLLASIFRAGGLAAGAVDSLGDWEGGDDDPPPAAAALTPPALARSLAEMAALGATHAILEVSSEDLSRQALAGVELDGACITHIGRRSLDWHGSIQNYRRAERRVLDFVRPDSVVILNADDPSSMEVLADLQQPALTFGLRGPAEITADIIAQHANEQLFVITAGDESVGVRTAMIGDHHVSNCLAATATALAYGIELTTIARGLEAVERLPGRMERLMCGQEFAVFVDAAQTPDALRSTLRAARTAAAGRVICVFGPQSDREIVERPVLGRVAGAMADLAIVTSADAQGDLRLTDLMDVRRGLAVPNAAEMICSRAEAIAFALDAARPGDAVVIAGLGAQAYFSPDCEDLTDGEVVRRVLSGTHAAVARPRLAA